MAKVDHSNGLSRIREHKSSPFGASSSNTPRQPDDFQKKVAEDIGRMCRHELAIDVPKDYEDVDHQAHIITEPDDSQPLAVESPLTFAKIFSKLSTLERLWLARMVKSHGKKLVLARWPAYEVHINYVRYLRQITKNVP